jgi:hypothetical protein
MFPSQQISAKLTAAIATENPRKNQLPLPSTKLDNRRLLHPHLATIRPDQFLMGSCGVEMPRLLSGAIIPE